MNYSQPKKNFTTGEALQVGQLLSLDFSKEPFDVEQFRMGLDVELEHGTVSPETNVTNDNPLLTGKIALAHLREFPDYYTRLASMESEAKIFWHKVNNLFKTNKYNKSLHSQNPLSKRYVKNF